MGYGSPRTLSDGSVRNCKGDIREFKPSVLVGVPAVWESVKKGIVGKVEGGSAIVRNLFWGALATKSFLLSSGLPGSGILDAIVFKKIKDATGGRLKICMNGGGPIAKDTQRFISMAIAPMIGGYGLTETTAMGGLMDPSHWTDQAIGDLPSCVEIKLVDFPDAGYYSTNNPPQGEVWIRGPSVLEAYFDNEQETKDSITADGWFKSGDIGEWDSNGQLRLIDRKKNLVKTQNGEYIALEKVTRLQSPFIPTRRLIIMSKARVRLPVRQIRRQHLRLRCREPQPAHRHHRAHGSRAEATGVSERHQGRYARGVGPEQEDECRGAKGAAGGGEAGRAGGDRDH